MDLVSIIDFISKVIIIAIPIVVFIFKEKIRSYFNEEQEKRLLEYKKSIDLSVEEIKHNSNKQIEQIKYFHNKNITLNDDQKLTMEAVLILFGSTIKMKKPEDQGDLEKRLQYYISKKNSGESTMCGIYISPAVWLVHKIINSSTSMNVYNLCLEWLHYSYKSNKKETETENIKENETQSYYNMAIFSLLYKELVYDFKKIDLQDDYAISLTISDYEDLKPGILKEIKKVKDNANLMTND